MATADRFARRIAELASEMGQSGMKVEAFIRANNLDPTKLTAQSLYRAMTESQFGRAMDLPGPAREYVPPVRAEGPPVTGGRDPVSFEERIAGNTTLRAGLEEIGVSTEGMTQEQVLEAAAEAFRNEGRRGRRTAVPPPADPPSRQMELPLGDGPTGMVPFGVRGAGIPVGGVRGPGVPVGGMSSPGGGMIPAEPRGLSNPNALTPENLLARLRGPDALYRPSSTEVGRPRLPRLPDKRLSTDVDLEGIPGPRPRVYQVPPRRLAGAVEEAVEDMPDFRFRAPVRTVDEFPPPARGAWRPLAAAAIAGAAGTAGKYIYDQLQNDNVANTAAEFTPMPAGGDSAIDSTDGAADLAAETSPPPVMETQEDPMDAPVDPSLEARKIINDLNARRRAAGGEVPEAKEMMAEVERLLAQGNQTRSATYVAAPQDDASRYFQQAQGMIDQVNQMYRQGMTPNSPEVRQIMAEVRRLQQMGDSLRNRRAG